MSVVECDVPRHSALGKDLIERADFRDAYRAPLSRSDLSVVEIFFAIFARRPGWMKLMLIARNNAAALAGLEVPTTSEIMNMEKRDRYFVGEKIGLPIELKQAVQLQWQPCGRGWRRLA
jgi:hypothetical protein